MNRKKYCSIGAVLLLVLVTLIITNTIYININTIYKEGINDGVKYGKENILQQLVNMSSDCKPIDVTNAGITVQYIPTKCLKGGETNGES